MPLIVYVGPYIETVSSLKTSQVQQGSFCEKCDRVRYHSGEKFCPFCGGKSTPNMVSKNTPTIDPNETAKQILYALYLVSIKENGENKQSYFWVPQTPGLGRSLSQYNSLEDSCPVGTALIDEEIEIMKSKYAIAFYTFRRIYGKKNVKVHWGILTYRA